MSNKPIPFMLHEAIYDGLWLVSVCTRGEDEVNTCWISTPREAWSHESCFRVAAKYMAVALDEEVVE